MLKTLGFWGMHHCGIGGSFYWLHHRGRLMASFCCCDNRYDTGVLADLRALGESFRVSMHSCTAPACPFDWECNALGFCIWDDVDTSPVNAALAAISLEHDSTHFLRVRNCCCVSTLRRKVSSQFRVGIFDGDVPRISLSSFVALLLQCSRFCSVFPQRGVWLNSVFHDLSFCAVLERRFF